VVELTKLGPFWFPDMFSSLGLSGSAGLMVGLIVVFAILPTIFIQYVQFSSSGRLKISCTFKLPRQVILTLRLLGGRDEVFEREGRRMSWMQ
jgi:hypothetical protein